MCGNMRRMVGLPAVLAMALASRVPMASADSLPPAGGEVRYSPIQSISYEFGSKMASGYFVEQSSACLVTLMIAENGNAEGSPARVRLMLYPGQIAGLDSEEGRSLNFTCGEDATTLLVRAGARDDLVALQAHSFTTDIAKRQ
jgi:hypothetical protein